MEKQIVLKNAKFVETTFEDGSKQMVGVVRGDTFVNLDIPTKPNPRQFIGEANPNYKEMVKTLRLEPFMFARKNSGGITMFASACDSNGDGSYTLTFKEGDGIANGGHTYHALKSHGRDVSQVKVTVELGLDKDNVGQVAEALNLNKRLQSYSLRNKEGAFDWHKKAIGNKSVDVMYHEGDSGFVEVKEAMAFLNLFKYDTEEKAMNILENIEQSEHANVSFLNRITKNHESFAHSLRWIAKDVHEIMKYVILNENFAIQLKPLKSTVRQNWLKPRGSDKKKGIMKGLALLLVAGLAHEGTGLNKNGVVLWKKRYNTFEARKQFIDELFNKLFDIVSVEEGAASEIIRQESVRRKTMRHAKLISTRLSAAGVVKQKKVG